VAVIGLGLIGLGIYGMFHDLLTAGGAVASAGGFMTITGSQIYRRARSNEIVETLSRYPF